MQQMIQMLRFAPVFNVPTFVKWAGGKTQLLKEYARFLPEKISGYVEPFLGSGALFFFVKTNYAPTKIILSDVNDELVTAFQTVRDSPEELIALLESHGLKHSEEYYYKTRAQSPLTLSAIEKAARFIYLNKTCFNGLYRVNGGGRFNVPIGSYVNPKIFDKDVIYAASKLLQTAKIEVASFEQVCVNASSGDFVYFDPPYYPLSKTAKFTNYASQEFLEKEQIALAKEFKELDRRGCLLMLSNSDTEFIKNLYADYVIKTVGARRAISCVGSGRGKISELVVTNY